MVRHYKKKTDKSKPSVEDLKNGLELIRRGYSLRTAAQKSGVHYACLHRVHKKTKSTASVDEIPVKELLLSQNSRSVFPADIEASIAEYCIDMSNIGYGLTVDMVRELGYATAVRNRPILPQLKIPDNWEKDKKASIDWYHGFMERHPELSVRAPEGCSLARTIAFNQHNVNIFQDKPEQCLERHACFADSSRVGNLDETSTSTVQNTQKVISSKGIKQVHEIKTAEQGVSVTTCCAGTLGIANENGYMTKEALVEAIKHVVKHTPASKENPFLLLPETVETHLSVEALCYMLCFMNIPQHLFYDCFYRLVSMY